MAKCSECGGSGRIVLLTSSRQCLACKPDADGLTSSQMDEWLKLHPWCTRVKLDWTASDGQYAGMINADVIKWPAALTEEDKEQFRKAFAANHNWYGTSVMPIEDECWWVMKDGEWTKADDEVIYGPFAVWDDTQDDVTFGGFSYWDDPQDTGHVGGKQLLSWFVVNATNVKSVYHRNGCQLDCTRDNLRVNRQADVVA